MKRVAERRNVVTEAQVVDFLAKLYSLPIETDDHSLPLHRDAMMALARRHGLSAFDANYLELALRTGARLATFDRKLEAAMRNAGGVVFE